MKTNAKEKLQLIFKKMNKEFEKDEQFKKRGLKAKNLSEDALVTAFDTILYKKVDKKLFERGSKLSVLELMYSPSKKLNLTEDDIRELEEVEHEVYMEWLGFDPLEEYREKSDKEKTFPTPVEEPTFFPITVKLDRKLRPLFLQRVMEKDFEKEIKTESGNILEVFKKDQWSREVYYYILKGQLETLRYVKTPSLSNLAYPCFISTLGFAIKQGTLSPSYTKTDKLRSLGYTGKEGGKILKLIEDIEKLLKFLTYDIIDKRKGRRYRESLGSLYSHLEIREKGRNVIFNPTLDPKTLGKDLPNLINDRLKGISWIDYSRIIKDKDLSPQQRRLFAYLEGLKGHKTTSKTARHLLLNIIGVSQTYFKERPTYCHKVLIDKGLEVAKAKPYLSLLDYKVDYKSCALDVRKWSFKLTFKNREDKKEEILPKNLVDKIVEWNCREVFGTKLKPEKVRGMVKNTITAYGEEVVRAIFEKEINSYSPHPKNFWAQIKRLKVKRLFKV